MFPELSHRYKWRHSTADLLEIHLTPLLDAFYATPPLDAFYATPLLDAFYASDPPLPTTLTTPRTPPELNPRILTTTDYDELLRPLRRHKVAMGI